MFKIIVLALLTVGCQTNVLCPKHLDFPKGAHCDVLLIPTPWDPITDIPAAAGTIRDVMKTRKGG